MGRKRRRQTQKEDGVLEGKGHLSSGEIKNEPPASDSRSLSLAKKVKILKDNVKQSAVNSVKVTRPAFVQCGVRCTRAFFDQPCEQLAKKLLGKVLVRQLNDGTKLAGVIVETEAYIGKEDKAAHSYEGRKTTKNEAMFMQPGTIYVYHIYGIYTCMNISANGDGAAVLLRAIDPVQGEDLMRTTRGIKRADKGHGLKVKDLCSGPSKLTAAFQIDKDTFNKLDIITSSTIWLEDAPEVDVNDIVISSRIGVNYAEEWTKKPLRFYIRGNPSVSVRDKAAEAGQT